MYNHYDVEVGYRMEVKSGQESKTIYSGGGSGTSNGFKFEVSAGEVRPSNKAICIWKTIK